MYELVAVVDGIKPHPMSKIISVSYYMARRQLRLLKELRLLISSS
jgi:hypothetical protein